MIDEAMTLAQRRARSRQMKRLAPRIKQARKRAMRKGASNQVIMRRAKRQARQLMFDRLARKDKGDMTYERRANIEKRLDKMQDRIDRLARKLIHKVRKDQRDRLSRRS